MVTSKSWGKWRLWGGEDRTDRACKEWDSVYKGLRLCSWEPRSFLASRSGIIPHVGATWRNNPVIRRKPLSGQSCSVDTGQWLCQDLSGCSISHMPASCHSPGSCEFYPEISGVPFHVKWFIWFYWKVLGSAWYFSQHEQISLWTVTEQDHAAGAFTQVDRGLTFCRYITYSDQNHMCPSPRPSLYTLNDCGGEGSTQMWVHTSSGTSGLWRGCPVGRAPWVSRLSQPDMNLESDPMALNRGRMPWAGWLRTPLRNFEVSTIRIIVQKKISSDKEKW